MITDLILARIQSLVPSFKTIGSAADLAAIRNGTVPYPALFVLPGARKGSGNRVMTGVVSQHRELTVQVVLAVRNISGAQGDKALADIDALCDQVDGALFGWQPAAEYGPLLLTNGRLLQMQDGVVWWQDDYVTAFERRTLN